jgi:hypothetical protein
MSIETVDDIVTEIANSIGVYGAHDEHCGDGPRTCRCCFESSLASRIRDAVRIETILAKTVGSTTTERAE